MDAQRAQIAAYCEARGWTLAGVEQDAGASGSTIKRPGLARVIERVHAGEVEVVVVARLDRLTRRQRHLLAIVEDELTPHGCGLASVAESFDTSTPAGRAMMSLLGTFAELERDTIRERTRSALAQVKAEGRHAGRIPYGSRLVAHGRPGELEMDPDEARVVRLAAWMRAQGHSLEQIGRVLNQAGHRTRSGARWSRQMVANVLRNPRTPAIVAAVAA
jgi:site-specific DNA recombinase